MKNMKTNLNSHDIYALVTELQFLIGSQVVNIYDITSQTICIKLRCQRVIKQNSENNDENNDENNNKTEHYLKYLIIDSSNKFYLLNEFVAINLMPSSFSLKLRKHIKNKRITKFEQINTDRVIRIKFGDDSVDKNFYSNYLICEFYASGNIILTDNEHKIMTLIHPYVYKDEESKKNIARVSVGNVYPIECATTKVNLDLESLKKMMEIEISNIDKPIKIKQFIMKLPIITYSPYVLEHSLLKCNISPNLKITNDFDTLKNIFTDDKILKFVDTIREMYSLKSFNGYTYDNNLFLPFQYEQFKENKENNKENDKCVEYNNFIECTSHYFSILDKIGKKEMEEKKENTKIEQKNIQQSKQTKMINNITDQINSLELKNQERKHEINSVINKVDILQNFLDYVNGNCKKFNLNNEFEKFYVLSFYPHLNQINFKYEGIEHKWNNSITVHKNIEEKFKEIKRNGEKIQKAKLALLSAQKNTKNRSDERNERNEIQTKNYIKQKKNYWFEEYNWFITSDGFLFVCGKTADQNEKLVKKYLEKGDIYVHSETFGSGSGIIKNIKINGMEKVVDSKVDIGNNFPKSIEECGNYLMCHTKAWKTGVPDKTYWVYPDQVTKETESGEYITKGSFVIRGTKNFIPAQKMELGFGIIFKESLSEYLQTKANENVEFGIPVVGAYSALSNYKFKVKITSGNQKIKKIFPQVLSSFYSKANPFEKMAIKSINNDDFQKVLITGIKFHI